jgi:hypothetical protein
MSFADAEREAEERGMAPGRNEIFKMQEGPNTLRICGPAKPDSDIYNGQKTFKVWVRVFARGQGNKLMACGLPWTVYRQIVALEKSEEYGFSGDIMPYDITITAKGAGLITVKYTILPARRNVPLTEAEQAELAAARPLPEWLANLKEKKKTATPAAEITADDIPF